MTKPVYDIMKCYDGATRAVPLINGVLVDPTLPKKSEVDEKKPKKKVVSIQDRLQNKVEDYISAVEGQADDFVDSGYKMKYDPYNHLLHHQLHHLTHLQSQEVSMKLNPEILFTHKLGHRAWVDYMV